MAQLKKPKSFSASDESVQVLIDGKEFTAANLLKSGIVNQKIVLVEVDDIWHEINVDDLGADDSNLVNFKNYVETYLLKLSDLGIESKNHKDVVDYNLKQKDFETLEAEFPAHDYVKIAILDSYLKKNSKSGMYEMRQVLKVITDREITIKDYIANSEAQKEEVINNKNPKIMNLEPSIQEIPGHVFARENQLRELGLSSDIKGYMIGHGFQITYSSIENDDDANWQLLIDRITAAAAAAGTMPLEVQPDGKTLVIPVETVAAPVPAQPEAPAPDPTVTAPAKKPVSLQVIGSLTPDRISDLQGLEESQNKIVTDNPFVTITDAKTLKQAKASKATLLKASTAIDGEKGILKNFVTHANQFIKMGKDYLNPLAKITRDAHDKQNIEIIRYENAAAIKEQQEKTAALVKIQDRTARLFAIPMVFNGELYSIGALYIVPSQIEKATDEEFEALVVQGIAIKSALDLQTSEKDKEIEALKQQLAAFQALNNLNNIGEIPAPPLPDQPTAPLAAPAQPSAPILNNAMPSNPVSVGTDVIPGPVESEFVPAAVSEQTQTKPVGRFKAGTEYIMADPKNTVVNKFDLDHADLLSVNPILPGFIKCRAYFVEGSKQTVAEILSIMNDPDVSVKKSVRITEFCETLLTDEC